MPGFQFAVSFPFIFRPFQPLNFFPPPSSRSLLFIITPYHTELVSKIVIVTNDREKVTDERIYSKPETDSCTVSVAGLLYKKEEHTQGRKQVGFLSH